MKHKQYRKLICATTLLSMILGTCEIACAQLVKINKLTDEQVSKRVTALYARKDGRAKDSIAWEARQLIQSKEQSYILKGKRLFLLIGDTEGMDKAHKQILALFPKSEYTADARLDEVLDEYMDYKTFEKSFKKWSMLYKELLSEKDFANKSYIKIALKLLFNGERENADRYYKKMVLNLPEKGESTAAMLARSKDFNQFIDYQKALVDYYIDHGNSELSEQILTDIFNRYNDALQFNVHKESLGIQYVRFLISKQKWDSALTIIRQYKLELIDDQFNSLLGLGKYFEAFLLLDKNLSEGRMTELEEKEGVMLFKKMGATDEEWNAYMKRAAEKNQQKLTAKAINEDAVDFELIDLSGKTVRLADFKGKIIVLDFWATWCVPCKKSFPGMQALVNKYKDDPEVVFLFIDTKEKKENYKAEVSTFIKEKSYDFHVLFDNMKEQESLSEKYKVTGIPFKVYIDRAGRVRFKTSGSSGIVKEVVDEVTGKIEYLKNLRTGPLSDLKKLTD